MRCTIQQGTRQEGSLSHAHWPAGDAGNCKQCGKCCHEGQSRVPRLHKKGASHQTNWHWESFPEAGDPVNPTSLESWKGP